MKKIGRPRFVLYALPYIGEKLVSLRVVPCIVYGEQVVEFLSPNAR